MHGSDFMSLLLYVLLRHLISRQVCQSSRTRYLCAACRFFLHQDTSKAGLKVSLLSALSPLFRASLFYVASYEQRWLKFAFFVSHLWALLVKLVGDLAKEFEALLLKSSHRFAYGVTLIKSINTTLARLMTGMNANNRSHSRLISAL